MGTWASRDSKQCASLQGWVGKEYNTKGGQLDFERLLVDSLNFDG